MEKKEIRAYNLEGVEIRKTGDTPIVSGYAAVFEKLSLPLFGFREKIRLGAFENSIRSGNVKALWNHNSDYPLASTKGKTLIVREDKRGLFFELQLPNTTWGKDAEESIRRGDTDGVSFGFETLVDEWDNSDPKNTIRTLVEVRLIEISPTPFPAYPDTSLNVRTAEDVYKQFQKSQRAYTERKRDLDILSMR
jgi:uncharacterized protein